MKFRLKTLLAVVTAAAIFSAVGMRVVERRRRNRERNAAFLQLDDAVSSIDDKLAVRILQLPTVKSQLQSANLIDPAGALAHSIQGRSIHFGGHEFEHEFHYDWQAPDGSRVDGIRITVDSVMQTDSTDNHVVRLTYSPSPENKEIAKWIEGQLESLKLVTVQHFVQDRDAAP